MSSQVIVTLATVGASFRGPVELPMNNDYRIEKDRVAVVLTTMSGERIAGDMFVQPYARYRTGREGAPDIMNHPEPYFPLAVETGDTLIVAKERVVEVALESVEEMSAEDLGARPAVIELVLTGGVVRQGSVFLEVPLDRPRLLDFMNRLHTRFLTLHTAEGIRLVNRNCIERVRPLD